MGATGWGEELRDIVAAVVVERPVLGGAWHIVAGEEYVVRGFEYASE